MYIARDSSGYLWLYSDKPARNMRTKSWVGDCLTDLPKEIYDSPLTWEDAPMEVELVIKKK